MWKSIKNFENYFCNKNGEFSNQGKSIKVQQHKSGYANVKFYKNGQQFSFRAHRIIYATFVGPILDGYEINHKNGIKNDNRLCNLEICTHSENLLHAVKNGLQPIRLGAMNKNSVAIYGICISTGNRIDFPSQADARRHGFNQGNIQAVLSGKRKQHGNHKWFYA